MKEKDKNKIDFDTLDITVATEEEIISSGIRKTTKKDIRNYILMGVVFVLMFIPPLLRLFIPKPILYENKKIAYVTLNCFVSNNRYEQTWRFDSKYKILYRDGKVQKVMIEYSYNKNVETAKDDVTFPEITVLNEIKLDSSKGFTKENLGKKIRDDKVEVHKRLYTLDFENHRKELESIGELKNYSYLLPTMKDYFKNMGCACNTEFEEKVEKVKVR